jgi:hypothetical protein
MIPVFERAKTGHTLDSAPTVISHLIQPVVTQNIDSGIDNIKTDLRDIGTKLFLTPSRKVSL